MKSAVALLAISVSLASFGIAQSKPKGALDKATLESYLRHVELYRSDVTYKFGDLECPDCRMEAPVLRKNVTETFGDKVRVFFKDFPLESIHPWARAAAIDGRCVYHQNAQTFWKFYDWIYDNQQEIEPDNLNS